MIRPLAKHELAKVLVHGAAHPGVVLDYRRGKKPAAGFLVGQVMKATQGKANPQLANRLLAERLGPG